MKNVITDDMLNIISRGSGIIYFVDRGACNVKMNGIMLKIDRIADNWFVSSPCQRFYDWSTRYGYLPERLSVLQMRENMVIKSLQWMLKIGEEDGDA